MYVGLRGLQESFNLAPLSPLFLSLSSSHRLSPRAQYNESRIDSVSRCPAVEMIGFGTEAQAGRGS